MFETEALALEAIVSWSKDSDVEGYTVEYCSSCEAWTVIGSDGYPFCPCV